MNRTKRKWLAAILTAAMSLTMVPAAFAAEPTDNASSVDRIITEEEMLADLDNAPETMSEGLTKAADGKYHIYTMQDFQSVTQSQWLGNNTFVIESDLDFGDWAGPKPDRWEGYITYFYGHIEGAGDGVTISGLENDRYLIFATGSGSIKNITLELNGEAAGLTGASLAYGEATGLTVENVDTTGYVNLTSDDQSNYSPYVYCAPQGGLTMKDCTNNAAITGNIYGGVFYGYYPLNKGASDDIVFDNCDNTANIHMRYASMFFGNPSVDNIVASADPGFTITVKNCDNTGKIRGTISAHYFVSSLSENLTVDGYSARMEKALQGTTGTDIGSNVVQDNNLPADKLVVGEVLDGFAVSADENGAITLTTPDNADIDHYVVTVSTYFNYYDPDTFASGGTDRYSVSEYIPASDTTVHLKYYGLVDAEYSTFFKPQLSLNNGVTQTYYLINGKGYYPLSKLNTTDLYDGVFQRYVGFTNSATAPALSYKEPAFLTATAYDSQGKICGMTSWEGGNQ